MPESNPEVATIRENVRHNEKAIDKLVVDLKALRSEITEFRKEVKEEIGKLRKETKEDIAGIKKNTDNLLWKLVATLAGSVILDVLVNKFV